MAAQSLPIKLNKEPLVDAVFEIRFSSSEASNILPGFLFSKLGKNLKIEHLSASEIPSRIRNNDPNLRFAPTMRIHWDNFLILIGDSSLGIACQMPYQGWNKFKTKIIDIVKILNETEIINNINRYSIKYIDIIDGKSLSEQISRINLDIKVGNHILKNEPFNIRVEITSEKFINIIQIGAPGKAQFSSGEEIQGVIVNTDTIRNYEEENFNRFIEELENHLDDIHYENKRMFFECLTPDTINYLEAEYE